MQLPDRPELTIEVRIYYYDTDAAGVVHNIAYLRMVEEARSRLAEHLGWTLAEMSTGECVPVVARTEIDYLKPARLTDTLLIHAKLTRLGSASFDLSFELSRKSDGAPIARCLQKMACVNLATARPVRAPSFWREKWPEL